MLLIPKIHGKLLLQLVPISSCFAAKGPGLLGLHLASDACQFEL